MPAQNIKALYNALIQHWKENPGLQVEAWQVVNYRTLSTEDLFKRLSELDYHLNQATFTAFAEEYENPEELVENLVENEEDEEEEDERLIEQIFLPVFELWRRLVPEKRSLSIFCDDLDQIITAYDENSLKDNDPVDTALNNLIQLVENNSEDESDAPQVFQSIISECANNVEEFLYDYIAALEDEKNFSYASELIDAFLPWVSDQKWFEFLQIRAVSAEDPEHAATLIDDILSHEVEDFSFYLELLAFLTQEGDPKNFASTLKRTLSLAEREEDFVEILEICQDYFHFLDKELEESKVAALQKKYVDLAADKPFDYSSNPDSKALLSLF